MENNRPNRGLSNKIEDLAMMFEKIRFAEYLQHHNNIGRILQTGFLSGLARGFGMAIGFLLLGALFLYLLQQIAYHNLPIIGDFIADIVKIVEQNLQH